MEYYLIYDVATGAVEFRGSGPPGIAAHHGKEVAAGKAVIVVPAQAVSGMDVDLGVLKAVAAANVGQAAELVRQRFITPGSGKAMSYQAKSEEARAHAADPAAPTPILAAEAAVRGMTLGALAAEVTSLRAAWTAAEAVVNAAEMKCKKGIADATNIPQIVAAAVIDWSQVTAA